MEGKQPPRIGMDTKTHREGLHLWIVDEPRYDPNPYVTTPIRTTHSIHLSREEAFWLMKEIERRLF